MITDRIKLWPRPGADADERRKARNRRKKERASGAKILHAVLRPVP